LSAALRISTLNRCLAPGAKAFQQLQDSIMSVRTLDLFCGGGGSSWGAREAGAEILCGIDAWDIAAKTFADNFPEASVVTRRLHPRSNSRLVGELGKVDLILASPECTSHTCARGSRERDEDSQGTARFVLNFVRAFEPRWVVIENVVQMKAWSGYASLLSELRRSYKVSVQTHDAADFQVPQQRRRLFIVCDRERDPPNMLAAADHIAPTVRNILDPTGTWRANPLYNGRRAKPTLERAERAIDALGRGIPFLIVYYGSDGAGGWQSLDRPLRTITTLDRFGLVGWDGNVPTLRMLQVSELRRAMGFGDAYRIERGGRRDKIKVLGNAVAPPVMTAIIQSLCGDALLPTQVPPRLDEFARQITALPNVVRAVSRPDIPTRLTMRSGTAGR
jgi:DNA (cytosine-5)-methyltransferase 1